MQRYKAKDRIRCREYRRNHPEKAKEWRERNSEKEKERLKENYQKRKQAMNDRAKEWRIEHRSEYNAMARARLMARRAVPIGGKCNRCDKQAEERHHPDYSKPL